MTAAPKAQSIKEFGRHEKDTGSPDVQVALLTRRINHLSEHLKANAKDFSSRRGLLMLVGQRRRMLDYVRSDVPQMRTLARLAGQPTCMHMYGLDRTQMAALQFHGQLRLVPLDDTPRCDWLVHAPYASSANARACWRGAGPAASSSPSASAPCHATAAGTSGRRGTGPFGEYPLVCGDAPRGAPKCACPKTYSSTREFRG